MKNADIIFLMREVFKFKGIWHSTERIVKYLNSLGISAKMVSIEDIGAISNVVKQHNPKIVFIEALWVHPNKIKTILNENPSIKNLVMHFHSDVPFFATEIFGFEWSFAAKKISDKIIISSNTENFSNAFDFVENLPNLYKEEFSWEKDEEEKDYINIYSAGAIRLMKNTLIQYATAINFAKYIGKKLNFQINDQKNNGGESVYRNMKAISDNSEYKIQELPWAIGKKYKNYIKNSTIGTQLSFSESFNNVTADFVCFGKPILVGDTINWAPDEYKSSSYIDTKIIFEKYKFLYENRNNEMLLRKAYNNLLEYDENSKQIWKNFIEKKL